MSTTSSKSAVQAQISADDMRSNPVRLYWVVFCICLLILVAATVEVLQLRASLMERAQSKTKNIAVSVTQTIDGLIDMIDVALLASADQVAHQRATKTADHSSISDYLVVQASRLPHVEYLRGTDAQGNLVYGPGLMNQSINLADREFFLKLRDNAALGLYMAKPVTSKMTGKALITFARRVNRPDGSFGGTVFASIPLDELTRMLSAIELDHDGLIALRDRDRGFIARHDFGSSNAIPMGDTRVSNPFLDALKANASEGTYVSDATSSNLVPRIYSYRVSQKYGYLVNVGESVDATFAEARQQAVVVFSFACLLCLSIVFAVWRVVRSRSHLEALLDNLAESNRQIQLQEHNQRLLLENLHTGIVVHAANGPITFSNALASKLLGLTAQQMLGKTLSDPTWHLVDSNGTTLSVADYPASRVMRSMKPVEGEVIGVAAPGNAGLVWLEVSAFPEFDDAGGLQQVVVNFQDATQRIHSEQARDRVSRALRLLSDTNMAMAQDKSSLALLEDVCRLMCEKGSYLIALVALAEADDPQSAQIVAQSGLTDIHFGQIGFSWNEAAEFGKGAAATSIRIGKTQVNRESEQHPDPADGQTRTQHFGFRSSIAVPFVKGSGKRGALMLYAEQVDAFNAGEIELLEELVANLAHGLDAREDQRRRIEAESATRAKANFLANMSHEIRTPLNAIAGMAYLIRRDGLSPSQADKLDNLEAANEHLLSIISNILDLSKIDADKLELEQTPLQVESIVAKVVSMVSEKAQGKNLQLLTDVGDMPLNLVGDFTRLQQALANYATNAIKFTGSGHVMVRASVLEESDQAAVLKFEVTDTGIGIDPPTLERLFSAFEQADNSTTRKYGGTGLGLAITSRLAHLMGGSAGASSQAGVGSTFWFTARLRKQDTEPPAAVLHDRPDNANTMALLRSRHEGLRVLLAEDEPISRAIARMLLEDIGFLVDEAEDGQEALDCADKSPYQLILMDMQMPRMNGLDATRAIRQLPWHGTTPIVGCSANAFQEDRLRCMAAGMTNFITKPTPPDKLYAAIFDVLEEPNAA